MEKRTSQRPTLIIISLIALIIILLLIFIDFSAVIEIIQTVDWTIMAMATVLLVLGYLFLTLRWRYLFGNRHDYQDLLQVTGSSYMFAILMQLPTSLYRLLVMERKSMAKVTESSSAIIVEVMLNMILRLIGVALVVSLLGARSKQSDIPLLVSLIFIVGLILLMFLLIGLRERLQPRAANVLSRLPKVDEQQATTTAAGLFRAASNAGSPKRFGIALFFSMC